MIDDKRTCYAVTSGEYSDYGVDRIFELREDAEAYIAKMGGGFDVEEFDYHPAGTGPVPHTQYSARWREWDEAAGIVESSRQTTEPPKHRGAEHYGVPPYPGRAYFYASGPDRERVRKSVSDHVARYKAERDGIA